MPLARGSSPQQPAPRWRRPLAIAGAVAVLVAIIAGVVWGVTRGNAGVANHPGTTPGATATHTPRVVYQSDWSHGADGWTLPATVQVADGHLAISGGQAVQVEIPYVPTTRNYTIEMDYQIVRAEIGGHFGLTAFNGSGDRQYPGADAVHADASGRVESLAGRMRRGGSGDGARRHVSRGPVYLGLCSPRWGADIQPRTGGRYRQLLLVG